MVTRRKRKTGASPPKAAPKPKPTLLDEDDLMKMLFYSPAGHGKTCLMGSAVGDERISPMLILDFEGGMKSIKSKIRRIDLDDLGEIDPQIEKAHVVKIREWEDFNVVYNFLANEEHEYQAVGVDSLSEVNYLNLITIVGHEVEQSGNHDPDIAYQEDYLRSIAQMRKLIRFFRDLPIHVFFSAGAQEATEPRTKKIQLRPSLTGKLTLELPGLVDTIGYLAVVEGEDDEGLVRSLYVQPTERFMAKDRSENGILGDFIDNPTLPRILDMLLGEVVDEVEDDDDEEE